MARSVSDDVRDAFALLLILAFVLAPLAWSAFELVPAAWDIIKIGWPEVAAVIRRFGVDVFLQAWRLWDANEFYAYTGLCVAFTIAVFGAYFGGPYRKYFCQFFYWSGFALLGYVLQRLSIAEGAVLALFVLDVSAVFPDVAGYLVASYDGSAAWIGPFYMAIAKLFGLGVVVAWGWLSWALVRGRIEEFQGQLQAAFLGQVDPVFPRARESVARACAQDRRKRIRAYLNDQKLPPATYTQVSFQNGETSFRFVREYVERRQEVHEVNPLRVAAFLEVPGGSPIKATPVTLQTAEEVAGQYARLAFESEHAPPPSWPMPWDSPDDMLLLLLGRVVDAAILADQHVDRERDDTSWNAMPFFERIYLDYRPIPGPLECFLGPLLGSVVPARVVIETYYPDVFRKALHGGKGKYGQFRNWFGIGVQIEAPNLPQDYFSRLTRVLGGKTPAARIDRKPWFEAPPVCRRLKSRIGGGISGRLTMQLSVPSMPNQPPVESELPLHVMASGPLADGCRSAVSSLPMEPPLIARGGVSNAPAMWLLPTRKDLHPTCKGSCVLSVPPDEATISVNLANAGAVHRAQREVYNLYRGSPNVGWMRGRAWMGAFFDRDLRAASRFPLLACSKVLGDSGTLRPDLRGAFVNSFWEKVFGGVFVATQGPEHASNLLLPEALLNDYLTHLPLAGTLAQLLPQVEEPPFVPSPAAPRSR